MISYEECKFEPCYTHVDLDTGVSTSIATTRLNKWLRAVRAPCLHKVQVDADLAARVARDNNIEAHRLARITLDDINDPILVGEWEDGKSSIFDGNHRLVAAVQRFGRATVPGYVVPPTVWRHFEIGGLPPEFHAGTGAEKSAVLKRMFSGIH